MAEQLDRSEVGLCQQWQDRFISLVTHYEQQVFSFVLSLVGEAVHAEKISRDVFVALFHKREGFDEAIPFEVSLYRWALELSRDQLSALEEQAVHSLSMEQVIAESVSCSALLAQETDRKSKVDSLVSRLPLEYRAVFLLHDVRGMGFDQVGAIMSMTPGEVRQILHRARLMLQRFLSKGKAVAEDAFDAKSFQARIGLGETDPATAN